ncbi:hypothetical protein A4A49_60294 [Nicotiana attenuata]|uniref:Uncharacterized protein n=1 Tax=Nicotiana attenuata TaxID=49451 RepID=A0A1J6KD27_NICAT|nr:hypothetical protein A4A49_60294 [Nicotiana attenuata]
MIKKINYCRTGTSWNITNGKNINLWSDHWIENNLSLRHLIQGPIPKHELHKPVAHLISHSTRDTLISPFYCPHKSCPSYKTHPSLQPNKEKIHPTGTTQMMVHLPLSLPTYIYYIKILTIK